MIEVEEKILSSGVVIGDDILKVDSFVNHQIDIDLLVKISKEFAKEFPNANKVLTIEASGIAFGTGVAMELGNVPLVFAKKSVSKVNASSDSYSSMIKSFTRNTVTEVRVNKNYLSKGDKIVIVDDFLAEGNAGLGLLDICEQAGAEVVGFCTVVEKRFQGGREKLEAKGIKVVAAASIAKFENGKPVFYK